MTPSHSLGLSVPSLTLSPHPAPLPPAPPESSAVLPAGSFAAEWIEQDDGAVDNDGGEWRTVHPEANDTQYPFHGSRYYLDEDEEEEEDEVKAHADDAPSAAALSTDGPSHFPPLLSNLPSALLSPHGTPAPTQEPPVLPPPGSSPAPCVEPINLTEAPAGPSSPASLTPPSPPVQPRAAVSASLSARSLVRSPARSASSRPRASLSQPVRTSRSLHSALAEASRLDPDPLTPSPPIAASLHPSLPPLEVGTLDEYALHGVDEETPGQAMEVELDDSFKADSASVQRAPLPATVGRAQPPSQPHQSSLHTRTAAASPPLSTPPPLPVPASQLLTDSQISLLVESQTFDDHAYRYQPTQTPSLAQSMVEHSLDGDCHDRELHVEVQDSDREDRQQDEPEENDAVDNAEQRLEPHTAAVAAGAELLVELDDGFDPHDSDERGHSAERKYLPSQESVDSHDSLDRPSFRLGLPPTRPQQQRAGPLTARNDSPVFDAGSISPPRAAPSPPRTPPSAPSSASSDSSEGIARRTRSRQARSASSAEKRRGGPSPPSLEELSLDVDDPSPERVQQERVLLQQLQRARKQKIRPEKAAPQDGQSGKKAGIVDQKTSALPQSRHRRHRVEEKEEEEEDASVRSMEAPSTDDDDDFVSVPRRTNRAARKLSSTRTDTVGSSSSRRERTAGEKRSRQPPSNKTSPSRTPPLSSMRQCNDERKQDEVGDGDDSDEETLRSRKRRTGTPVGSGRKSAARPPPRSSNKSDARLKQTALTDFSFSSCASLPSQEDVFVRPAPRPTKPPASTAGAPTSRPRAVAPTPSSSAPPPVPSVDRSDPAALTRPPPVSRVPFADLTNVIAAPRSSDRTKRDREGSRWQVKRRKSGLLTLRDEGPSRVNEGSAGRPVQRASVEGSSVIRSAEKSKPAIPDDPYAFVLVDSQDW